MRKKVRKSLAFLLALALIVSVMSGLGLSVSADETPVEDDVAISSVEQGEVQQGAEEEKETGNDEEETEPVAQTPAQGEPQGKEEKAAGEGSGDKEEEPKAPASNDAEETEKKDEEQQQADPSEEKPLAVMANGEKASQYTVTYKDVTLTVKLVDEEGNAVQGVAPDLTKLNITVDNPLPVKENFAATVEGYTYSRAYYKIRWTQNDVPNVVFHEVVRYNLKGWYTAKTNNIGSTTFYEIEDNTLYLVYERKPGFTIHYVDENGEEIVPSEWKEDASEEVTFASYAKSLPGYTYWRACYSTANNAEITSAKKGRGSNYTFYKGDVALKASNNGSNWDESISTLQDVYLVYVKDGVTPTPGGTTGGSGTATATNTKTATRNDDGTYDLSLTASGSVGTSENKAILDVVFILDTSGSMDKTFSGSGNKTKIKSATDAIKTMVNSLKANDKIDARFSLVTFASGAVKEQDWTDDADTLNRKLPSSTGGGTNYQAAFIAGKSLLDSSNRNATRVVVFVSDGNPTYYKSANSNDKAGTGNSDTTGRGMSNARGIVKTMLPNYLFTVGVGAQNDYSKLSQITDAAHSGVKTANYAGTDSDKLKAAFAEMEGTITSVACEDVTINDTLSENVEMVLKNGAPEKLVGTVTGAKAGDVTNNADGTITLAATALNGATTLPAPTYSAGKIQWEFPAGYKLEANYTYTVTAKISVTEKAYQNYRNNGNSYPDQADKDTGTHERQKGLYSNVNTEATLTYKQTGKSEYTTVYYAKPVVQLNPGSLVIEKKFEGLTDAQIESLKNTLTFQYKLNNGEAKSVKLGDMTHSNGSYRATVETGLSPNTTYTVTESGAEVENYDVETKTENVTGTISAGSTATAAFTNSYEKSVGDLTIRKAIQVDGTNYTGTDFDETEYTFTVQGPDDVKGKTYNGVAFNANGSATVTITGASSITLNNLPVGEYSVKETREGTTPDKYDYQSGTDETQKATLTKDGATITVTNQYKVKTFKVYVRKVLDGNMYDDGEKFSFAVNGDSGTYTLGHNETSRAYSVKYGGSYAVREEDSKGYTTTAKAYKAVVDANGNVTLGAEIQGDYDEEKLIYNLENVTQDVIIVYTNSKSVNPPTGITTNVIPYVIMVVLAAGAGVFFFNNRRYHGKHDN